MYICIYIHIYIYRRKSEDREKVDPRNDAGYVNLWSKTAEFGGLAATRCFLSKYIAYER